MGFNLFFFFLIFCSIPFLALISYETVLSFSKKENFYKFFAFLILLFIIDEINNYSDNYIPYGVIIYPTFHVFFFKLMIFWFEKTTGKKPVSAYTVAFNFSNKYPDDRFFWVIVPIIMQFVPIITIIQPEPIP
jgi:hypothetical protein